MKKRIPELYERYKVIKRTHDLKNSVIYSKLSQTEKLLLEKLNKSDEEDDQFKTESKRARRVSIPSNSFNVPVTTYRRHHPEPIEVEPEKPSLPVEEYPQLVVKHP